MGGPARPEDLARIAAAKERLRTEMRRRLALLGDDERRRLGALATGRFDALAEVRGAADLVLFRSLAGEVDTAGVFAAALERGQRVWFPCVAAAGLELRRATRDTAWRPGPLGNAEPAEGETCGPGAFDSPAAVIAVPGIAFTPRGERLGRGGGHYDRALAALAGRALAVGLAFDLQVVPAIPTLPHDRRVTLLVTEERAIRA
jgi:5-formyltetrahydrofolate cyclo-ligase